METSDEDEDPSNVRYERSAWGLQQAHAMGDSPSYSSMALDMVDDSEMYSSSSSSVTSVPCRHQAGGLCLQKCMRQWGCYDLDLPSYKDFVGSSRPCTLPHAPCPTVGMLCCALPDQAVCAWPH